MTVVVPKDSKLWECSLDELYEIIKYVATFREEEEIRIVINAKEAKNG